MELPAQAIPCRLTNMCAPNETWSEQATRQFMQLVAHRVIMARVTHVSRVMSVCLCDTSGDDDIHINDVLIKSGLAKKCQDQSVRSHVEDACKPFTRNTVQNVVFSLIN